MPLIIFQFLSVSYNAHLDTCMNVTLHTLQHRGWHVSASIGIALLKIQKFWQRGRILLLFEILPQEESPLESGQVNVKVTFRNHHTRLFVPWFLPPGTASLVMSYLQAHRHAVNIHSGAEVTAGSEQNCNLLSNVGRNVRFPGAQLWVFCLLYISSRGKHV